MIDISNVKWKHVSHVSDIDQLNCTIAIHYINGCSIRSKVPAILMRAMMDCGEQNYIDQDIERYEWNPNRPD